jgi:excinuclease ABC subunit A
LGPEGGEAGGRLVFEGTPEALSQQEASHTGRYLRKALQRQAELESRRKPVTPSPRASSQSAG